MKRAASYVRVSTIDQPPETQLRELREYAQRRGLSVTPEHPPIWNSRRESNPDLFRSLITRYFAESR